MQFATLGRTGVHISVVTLGAAFFGGRISADDSKRILDRAFDLGINSIDTAEAYLNPNPKPSETVLGDLLQGRRDEVFLATKVSPHRSRCAISYGVSCKYSDRIADGRCRSDCDVIPDHNVVARSYGNGYTDSRTDLNSTIKLRRIFPFRPGDS